MKKLHLFLLAVLIPAFVFISCKDDTNDNDDGTTQSAQEILTDYLKTSGMDLDAILDGWIVGPPATEAEVPDFVATYNIIDLRSAEDYNAGHIEGAENSSLADILTTAEAFEEDKPILVVCYTGQNAGHGVVALRLSGYEDAVVLKWGMAGWGPTWASSWSDATATLNHANWSSTVDLSTAVPYDPASFSSTNTTGENILEERVESMLAGGLQGIGGQEVLDNYEDYFINNYWAETDVTNYGHIAGAFRINPLTLTGEEIYNLDPEQTIVTYCWTGQTSSMITAYLTVLGYDALSLKFGANGMIYDNLESHKYVAPTVDLPTE